MKDSRPDGGEATSSRVDRSRAPTPRPPAIEGEPLRSVPILEKATLTRQAGSQVALSFWRRDVGTRERRTGSDGAAPRTIPMFGSGAAGAADTLELTPQALAGPALAPDRHDSRTDLGHDRGRAEVDVAGHGDGGSDP